MRGRLLRARCFLSDSLLSGIYYNVRLTCISLIHMEALNTMICQVLSISDPSRRDLRLF